MKKTLYYFDKFEEYLLASSLVVTVLVVFLQVIMRYVFQSSLSWSEELARYLFVYQTWLGAALGVKYRKHIRVELLLNALPLKGRQYLDLAIVILCLAFCAFLAANSSMLVNEIFSKQALSPGMHMKMGFAYASVPIGCGLMSIRLIQQLIEDARLLKKGGE